MVFGEGGVGEENGMTQIFVMSGNGKVVDKIDKKIHHKVPTGFYKEMSFVKYKGKEYHVTLHGVGNVLRHVIYPWGGRFG